ncbi:protein-tyrosine phosphatase-like protein [Flammula alnicola]|nr:protein-tyrosine phosphatase-like protein [Flammula alnicola]
MLSPPTGTPQLTLLASQHHASEYNRSKFGAHGCPVPYLPLSVQLPDQFKQLRSRQLVNAQDRSWWPAPPSVPDTSNVVTHSCPPVSLQDEIMAAMSEPLHPSIRPPHAQMKTRVKTSLTHPINISSIVPPDLIDLISSHALLSSARDAPTLLEIPSSFTLDRLSTLRDTRLQNLQSVPPPPFVPVIPKQLPANQFRTRSNISDALQAAINTGIDYMCQDKSNKDARTSIMLSEQVTNRLLTGFTPDTSVSLSLSMTIPSAITLQSTLVTQSSELVLSNSLQAMPLIQQQDISASLPLFPRTSSMLPTWISPDIIIPHQTPRSAPAFTIGNLFLSSCPGKKVRLDGPIKGRSGVCRDLETDMKRMKELGVGCIVCCLDDSELAFLGAPWPEYEYFAKTIGIDILRLPIPEGLPPISASLLDAHLVDLISRYSMNSIPILVHCRGGVGRAGVIACCWMIRLGLCGWVDGGNPNLCSERDREKVPHADSISFVEKVIALVRRRRSMKAVETYEQVKFLVDYVEHLRHGSPERPQESESVVAL